MPDTATGARAAHTAHAQGGPGATRAGVGVTRRCWWANMLPTFAVGIPLSRSPLENFFVGGQLQPVPGLSLLVGAHIGKINALRNGFGVGQAAPVLANGFRIEDAIEQKYSTGFFIGVGLTDSLFINLVTALIGRGGGS